MDNTVAGPGSPARAAQIDQLYREHHRALVGFLHSRLGSNADAQELAQEVYLRLLTMDDTSQITSPKAFLFRVAANLSVDRLRMRAVRTHAALEPPPEAQPHESPIPEQHATAIEQVRGLRAALAELPPKTSKAFVMYAIEGREFSAIAQDMKLSERMVRYHVTNALAYCRERCNRPETI
ncbi:MULTISPECIES: RNA polymerase sigma factor [Dyella]|uniref:Sigma-70 family RNA polymerase sigma factor n=2 Tax=Dyella TaxID=231454 RepID=A0A4R0Z108_9GAMM|nr:MULTISPECIES: sigma-70 family RNA polymerase sigma factor [Dyella]TBR39334.1 sigma-70 family RNA polymerase sigma factor [Dyella terrae]TCI13078.1 sigma-70 family RNA polymerase sigma factor [Dyella soli]